MTDPVIAKTLRAAVGLRDGGDIPGHDVLATYRGRAGIDVFALCRDGLLLRQGQAWRYIDNGDVEDVDLPIAEAKSSIEGRRLTLVLHGGERVDVPVDGGDQDSMDIFPIHAFVWRRVHQHKMLSRRP